MMEELEKLNAMNAQRIKLNTFRTLISESGDIEAVLTSDGTRALIPASVIYDIQTAMLEIASKKHDEVKAELERRLK